MKKTFFGGLLMFTIFLDLILTCSVSFATAQSGTTVSGIIALDTKWTAANSPYSLTGPIGIPSGVTLTIEPGAAVYLYNYYIMVNGTLLAKGNSTDPVFLNGGWGGPGIYAITFEPSSSNWTQATGTGCTIEKAVLNETNISIQSVSPRINNDTFISSPIRLSDASPVISNNDFSNSGVEIMSSIYSPSFGAPVIVNNSLSVGEISFGGGTPSAFATISNNTIHGGGIGGVGYAYINDNTISGCIDGLALNTAVVFGGSEPAYPIVTRNLITQNTYGIHINLFGRDEIGALCPLIENNTISQNSVGIYLTESQYASAPTIMNNNFEGNSNYNIYLDQSTSNDVNATHNWWGTTDMVMINQTMHDFKNDFTLGLVNFIPFLTAPNSEAMPNLSASLPASPSSSLTTSPTHILTPTPTSIPQITATPSPSFSPITSMTALPTTNQSSTVSTSPKAPTTSPLLTELITGIVAIIVVAVAVAAFLAGKKAGQKINR
jgi:parallel beta-helix repeat protein